MRKLLTSPALRPLMILIICLWTGPVFAASDDKPVTYYSTTGAAPVTTNTTSCVTVVVLTTCSDVDNAGRASDASLTNYATLSLGLVTSEVSIKLKLNGTAPAYSRAGVVVSGTDALANLTLVGGVKLTTYLAGVEKESHVVEASLLTAALLSDEPTRLEFQPANRFDEIKLTYYQTVSVTLLKKQDLRVYYAYGSNIGTLRTVTGYVSNVGGATISVDPGNLGVCAETNVAHPEHAADTNLTDNYASFTSLADVGCAATLNVDLNGTAIEGYYAGFVVGQGSLLDLDVSLLAKLTIKTYLGNTLQESGSGASLLRLTALPDGSNRYVVTMKASKPFNRVAIQRNELVSVLNDLRIYYGFGVEPRTFEAQQIVRSDNTTGTPTSLYRTQSNSVVVATVNDENGFVNPQHAATGPSLEDFTKIRSLLNVAGTQKLRVKLNGTGPGGSRAGVVLKIGGELLDASLLASFRINTYANRDDMTPIETSAGSSLVLATVLGGSRSEISFRTTQDFGWVELEINNGVSLLGDVRMYYAVVDDLPMNFPTSIVTPAVLPVELTKWQARAQAHAVVLEWNTASELHSSYFVVERALRPDAEKFDVVGQRQAAGTSAQPLSYQLVDSRARQLGVSRLYYRLRQVDQDGRQTVSEVRTVQLVDQAYTLQAYPSPASGAAVVRLQLTGPAEAGQLVRLSDSQGRVVATVPVERLREGLATRTLKAGLYHLTLQAADGQRLAYQKLLIVE